MRAEGGQASVEWIGALLAIALVLASLGRLAARADGTGVALAPLRTTTCAAAGGCAHGRGPAPRAGRPNRSVTTPHGRPERSVTTPPLVAPVPATSERRPQRAGGRRPEAQVRRWRPLVRRARPLLRRARPLVRRWRRPAGVLWRRAWVLCFWYERARYGVLHPGSRARQTVPVGETLRIANDCLSPIDLARDWELLRRR